MSTVKFTVPNWVQAQIAKAINLDPDNVVVRNEDDQSIYFLQYKPRKEFLVNKATGHVIEC